VEKCLSYPVDSNHMWSINNSQFTAAIFSKNAVICNCIIPCIFKIYNFLISYDSDCLSIEQSTTKVICVKRIVE
jgi:hypothetical protein